MEKLIDIIDFCTKLDEVHDNGKEINYHTVKDLAAHAPMARAISIDMLTDILAQSANDPDLKRSINRVLLWWNELYPEKFDVGDIIQQDTIKGIIIDRNDKTKEYGIIWDDGVFGITEKEMGWKRIGRTTAVKQLLDVLNS